MNVLIIEEDPMVREVIVEYIKEICFLNKIFTSKDFMKCKEEALSGDYQLIMVDTKSYQNEASLIIKELRNNYVDIEIIVVTSDNRVNEVRNIMSFGVQDYILKPFTKERIISSVKLLKCKNEILKNHKTLSQVDIDELYAKDFDCSSVTRGINFETYNKIYLLTKEQKGYFTTKDITNSSSFSRITVRRYLEHMKDNEILVVEQKYGNVGRPIKYYKLK